MFRPSILLCCALLLASCSDRDDSDPVFGMDSETDRPADDDIDAAGGERIDRPFAEGPGLSGSGEVFGFWDASVRYLDEFGTVRIDERYVLIDPLTGYTVYDFDGDEFGSPERQNCFVIDGPDPFRADGADRFRWREQRVDARERDDVLDIRFEDGGRGAWPRVVGLDVRDLPICDRL